MNYISDESVAQWVRQSKNLLDSLNIGFNLVDMGDNILEVNDSFLKMTESRAEDIIGHNVSEFYKKADYEKMRNLEVSLQKQGNFQYEFFVTTTSREKIPALINISTIVDREGRPIYQLSLITDIREQKKIQAELETLNQDLSASKETLQNEKNKLEAILFGIGDCVTVFDRKGNLILSNPKGKEIRGERLTPLLSLESGNRGNIALSIGNENRHFFAQIEAIQNTQGKVYAFAEILRDITDQKRLAEKEQELFRLTQEMKRNKLESEFIGVSRAMQKVFNLIIRCSEVDSTVLITGETGVGKELAAKAIHNNSFRKEKPFIAINCSAIPEPLLESELFGHVKGAFTGAISNSKGLFREAKGGTLFFDEIGDLAGPLQAKILRVLQEKEIRPVGDSQTYPVDVRVITATNKNLKTMVEQQLFRDDLYYRIAVIPISIPPLRDRKDDILPLAIYFIEKYAKVRNLPKLTLNHAAQELLLDYSWPGNARELENCIEYITAMNNDPIITPENLPVQIVRNYPNEDDKMEFFSPLSKRKKQIQALTSSRLNESLDLQELEKAAILEALQKKHWNRTSVAQGLGISRATLWRKMKKYHLN